MTKKAIRIIIAAIVVTVFNAIFSAITCGWLFNSMYKLEPTNVWKSMENFNWTPYYVAALILSLVFVIVYVILCKGIPGKNKILKGIVFGLCVWAVGMLPGMAATYFFMTVNQTVVLYWLALGLVQTPIAGFIAAVIYGE